MLVQINQVVGFSELVDELWPERPPKSAMTTVQTYVYKLRKDVLDVDGTAQLSTESGGYRLTVDVDRLDEHQFEALRRDSRRAYDRGDLEEAHDLLTRALALWRGPALLGVRTGDRLAAHVTRLQEDRLHAHTLRVEVGMLLGRYEELTRELRGLITDYPFHERLHVHLMTALDSCGRRYEALQVFRRFREHVVEELGLEPSAEIQQLHRSLLSRDGDTARRPAPARPGILPAGARPDDAGRPQRPAVAFAPARPAASPTRPVTAPAPSGVGPPVAPGAGSTAASAPIRLSGRGAPSAGPVQLPPDPPQFIGRMDVLRWMQQALAPASRSPRLLLVSGMAGMGKTTVAVRAGWEVARDYPDGQFLVDLRGSTASPLSTPEVLAAVLPALGVTGRAVPADPQVQARLYAETVATRRVLVVLDDAASAEQLAPLVPPRGGSAVIVTSRPPLEDLPWQRVVRLEAMDTVQGVELLVSLTSEDRVWSQFDAATRIVQACGGLPLALSAAGARLAAAPLLPLGMMATLLRSETDALDHLSYEGLDVRASLDLSYFGLDEQDRCVLRLLSLLPPGEFTRAKAASLLGAVPGSVERQLGRLVEHHLLGACDELSGVRRYHLHPLMRVYLRERLRAEFLTTGT